MYPAEQPLVALQTIPLAPTVHVLHPTGQATPMQQQQWLGH